MITKFIERHFAINTTLNYTLTLMRNKLIICLFSIVTTIEPISAQLLNESDLLFLKEMTIDVLEDSKIKENQSISPDFGPNNTGGILIRPGGRDCYPAFWIRDYAMSLDCGFVSPKDQLHMLKLTAATQCDQTWITKGGSMIPSGAIADHVRIDDSLPIFFPGTYSFEGQGTDSWGKVPPYSDQFFFIHMAHYYVKSTGQKKVLNSIINGFRLIDRLEWAFKVPPSHLDNHIVYTTEHFRGVDFGFRDAQVITGDLCIASVFKYKASIEMAELFKLLGNKEKSVEYQSIAEKLKKAIPETFCDDRGMLCASTGMSSQADVWSTVLAVFYGILEEDLLAKTCSTLADAYKTGTLAYKGNIRHILTSDDFSESTAWEHSFSTINTYQNGAYWGTPTGWTCYAIAKADIELARQLAREYIENLRENDYRKGEMFGEPYECINPDGHKQNPVYLTTVTCPFHVFTKYFNN